MLSFAELNSIAIECLKIMKRGLPKGLIIDMKPKLLTKGVPGLSFLSIDARLPKPKESKESFRKAVLIPVCNELANAIKVNKIRVMNVVKYPKASTQVAISCWSHGLAINSCVKFDARIGECVLTLSIVGRP